MSLTGIRKDILELKRVAAFEKKQFEDDRVKNMTDEELQQVIDEELAIMGFKSEEELCDAAKKYCVENGLKKIFYNDYNVHDFLFENPDHFFNIIQKYGNHGESE